MPDEVGTIEAFGPVSEPRRVHRYICLGCGEEARATYPTVDGRYATGRCSNCHDTKKPQRKAMPPDTMVREDLFDRAIWQMSRERAELQRLVVAAGRPPVALSDAQLARLTELHDKYGAHGYILPDEIRKIADAYAASRAGKGGKKKREKVVRGRGA
jgi:hypothetical protein